VSLSNTGQSSQTTFEEFWDKKGKHAYLERRVDLAHVRGLNKGKALVFPAQGNDYFLTTGGLTTYAEVKSCSSKTSFPFSQIEKAQWACATRVTASKGLYVFYVHSVHFNRWYAVPAKLILDCSKKSLTWDELEPHRWFVT